MEEIKFFGGASVSGVEYFGTPVKAWSALNSARGKLAKLGIQVPFTYIMNMEEAKDVNSKSFTFPLRVIISADSSVESPPKYAKNAVAFQSIITKIKGDATILVSRMLPSNLQGEEPFYMSKDGIQISSASKNYTISLDLKSLFKKSGLSAKYTYRLCWIDTGWVIESIFNRKNPFVKEMYGNALTDLSDEGLLSFRKGFFLGFNEEPFSQAYSSMNWVTKLTQQFLISEVLEVSRTQGYFLGQMMKSKLSQTFSGLLQGGSMLDKVKTVAALDTASISQFKSFAALHNAIVESDRDAISESINLFFHKEAVASPAITYSHLCRFRSIINSGLQERTVDDLASTKWNDYKENLSFDMDMEFDIEDELTLEGAQFRVLEKNHKGYSIRFQAQNAIAKRTARLLKTGEEYILSNKNQKSEISFTPENSSDKEQAKLVEGLKFKIPSQAGTKVTYAPVIIKGDQIVSTENNEVVICSLAEIKTQLQSMFL